jgi:hypothetical protein
MTKTPDGQNILALSQGFNSTGGAIYELDRSMYEATVILDTFYGKPFNDSSCLCNWTGRCGLHSSEPSTNHGSLDSVYSCRDEAQFGRFNFNASVLPVVDPSTTSSSRPLFPLSLLFLAGVATTITPALL